MIKPFDLTIDTTTNTGVLTFNTFSERKYKNFHKTVDSLFLKIIKQNIQNLIIDIRKNNGGEEGYEDYVFSYLTNKPYTKYKYVQLSAFSFFFYKYTIYKNTNKQERFEKILQEEHELTSDGRILRKKGIFLRKLRAMPIMVI